MKYLKFLCFVCLFSALAIACGDDDPNDGNVNCNDSFSLNNEIADELNAVNAATTAYGNDPSTANCQALVAAWGDYLDAAEAFEECAADAGQGAEYQAALDAAQASIDSFPC